jgi:hypothetical protein
MWVMIGPLAEGQGEGMSRCIETPLTPALPRGEGEGEGRGDSSRWLLH